LRAKKSGASKNSDESFTAATRHWQWALSKELPVKKGTPDKNKRMVRGKRGGEKKLAGGPSADGRMVSNRAGVEIEEGAHQSKTECMYLK